MALDKFKAAPIPNPPSQYDPQYMRQVIRVIENYFSQLDSRAGNNAESYTADTFNGGTFNGSTFNGGTFNGSGIGLTMPHNQFTSLVDQSAAAIDIAYPVRLEVTSFTSDISITGVNNTRITFAVPGVYMLIYSLSFKNTTNDTQEVNIWFRYNNGTTTTDVPNSNSRFTLPPRKSTGDPSFLIAVTPFSGAAVTAGDWVEVVWATTSTSVVMEHLPAVAYSAGVTPAHPGTPSAIVEAFFVSSKINVRSVTLTGVSATGSIGTVTVTV
jgi:hypothetical protein